MELSIRHRHLDMSEPLEAYIARRLRFAIGAFDSRITSVDVRVADVNGPRGGIDKRCIITVLMRPIGRVFALAMESDAYSAVDRAATRIRAVLVRTLNRRRERRRRLGGRRRAPASVFST